MKTPAVDALNHNRCILTLWLVILCFCRFSIAQEPQSFTQRLTPNDEPIPDVAPIRVAVNIGGVDKVFMVDTGATIHFFDKSIEKELSEERGQVTVTTAKSAKLETPLFLSTSNISIGSNEHEILGGIGVADLKPLSRVFGFELSGILGSPSVIRFGLGYEESEPAFYLGRSSIRVFQKQFPVRLSESDRLYYTSSVQLEEDSMLDEFMIDTGMNGAVSVMSDRFEDLLSKKLIHSVDMRQAQTLNGIKRSRFGLMSQVVAWGFPLENVPVRESSSNKIGLQLLRRFNFFLDPRNGLIEIESHQKSNRPFPYDRSGISLVWENSRICVDSVREATPGASAGLSSGDVILAVNDQPIEADWQTLYKLREIFSQPSSASVRLLVRSQNSNKTVDLKW